MKKNVRDYKINGSQYAYILDAITPDNYGLDGNNMSDREKVIFLLDVFSTEYNSPYEKRRCPSVINRFESWIRGLPSAFNIAFTNYAIIETGKSWGYCKTEKQADRFVENWFHAIAVKVFSLAGRLGIEIGDYV